MVEYSASASSSTSSPSASMTSSNSATPFISKVPSALRVMFSYREKRRERERGERVRLAIFHRPHLRALHDPYLLADVVLVVVFVVYFPHHLLQNVLKGDQAGRAAVLVDHDGHVHPPLAHLLQGGTDSG